MTHSRLPLSQIRPLSPSLAIDKERSDFTQSDAAFYYGCSTGPTRRAPVKDLCKERAKQLDTEWTLPHVALSLTSQEDDTNHLGVYIVLRLGD